MAPQTKKPRDDYRDSFDDDVEGGRATEAAPLLQSYQNDGNGTSNGTDGDTLYPSGANGAPSHLADYPALWWAKTKNVVTQFQTRRADRGKQRQQETSAAGTSQNASASASDHASHGRAPLRARLRQFHAGHPILSIALAVLLGLILLLIVLIVAALIHLFAFTLRSPDEATRQRILDRSVAIAGPDSVQVQSISENGITVQVDGRISIDPDAALDAWLGTRGNAGWWQRRDRSVIEWTLNKVKGVEIDLETIAVRSPDWSVARDVDRIDLLPPAKKDPKHTPDSADEMFVSRHPSTSPLPPSDLVTFDLEPLFVPVPAVGSRTKRNGVEDGSKATEPISLLFDLKPSGPALLAFAQNALENKTAFIDMKLNSARIRGMSGKDWLQGYISSSSWFSVPGWVDLRVGETWRRLAQKLPKMDQNNTNTDDFLNLTRYDFYEIGGPGSNQSQRALGLDAYAEATNPIGKLLQGHIGYSLPFGAFLPVEDNKDHDSLKTPSSQPKDVVLLAAVATEPFDIHGEKKIPLRLHGRVVPPPQPPTFSKRAQEPLGKQTNSTTPPADPAGDALSNFLSRFLRGDPNTLYVRGGSPFATPKVASTPLPGGGSEDLPVWLDRLLRTVSVPITFPGSKVTELIQNVTISDLKITPHPFEDDKLVCSGIIMGVMNLPGQLATVDVEITDLWPDVLIYNGKPPSMRHGNQGEDSKALRDLQMSRRDLGDAAKPLKKDDGDDAPTPDPLPDPLPEHAFGRVVPRKWAPATTYIDPDDPKGQRKLLRSELKNVPFTVLPGRGAEFRSFSWKIVTGEGALAGIEGKAQSKIWNSGLGKLTLSNLPVKGVFTVGKRGGDGDDDGDDGLHLG